MLPALEIKNFKSIKHLTIPKLRRVNLFTGKNNTGKSSLLEAVYILINNGSHRVLHEIISERIQGNKTKVNLSNIETIKTLFGSKNIGINNAFIVNASANGKIFKVDLFAGTSRDFERFHSRPNVNFFSVADFIYERIFIVKGDDNDFLSVDENIYILSENTSLQKNIHLWDKIVLTDKEDQVVDALKIIEPRIQRLAFIDRGGERVAMVRLKGGEEAVELQSMGDGINRILSIVLAAVNVAGGYLLIDEFENGLHYSVQEQLWKVLFQMANDLDIQLFVTTHSSDCINSFEEVLNEQTAVSGQLFRLERNKDGEIQTVSYNKDELQIATDNDIETR